MTCARVSHPSHARARARNTRMRRARARKNDEDEREVRVGGERRRRVVALVPLSFAFHANASTTNAKENGDARGNARYDAYASHYDDLDGGVVARMIGMDAARDDALRACAGDVLELAVGTGLNLSHYDRKKIRRYSAIDVSPGMLARARARARELEFEGTFATADATALPFEDASFDVVVDTFSLCVMTEPVKVLREVKRVLRANGRAVLIEHSRSDNGALGAYQDATSKPVEALSKGCVWNQDVEGLIRESGLKVVSVERALLGLLVIVEATP